MRKQGLSEATALLCMFVMLAIRHNPAIRDLCTQSLGKSKSKMSAMVICMHKLLRIIYGVLKSGKAFDPAIDQAYKTRRPDQRKPIKQEIRHFQPLDDNAPISARKNKKRKE